MTGVPGSRPTRILVVVLACLHAGEVSAAGPVEGGRIQAELERLTEELNSLDSWLSRAQQRRLRLLKDLRTQDRAVAAAVAGVGASDAALAQIGADLARLDAERNELQAKKSRESRRIGEHLAAAYRLQGRDFLKLLLDQRSPAPAARMLVYHRYLVGARLDALESYRLASSQLERNAAALAAREAAERKERQRLVVRKRELEQNRMQRRTLIATLERDVEDRAGLREAVLRDRQRLQALFAELRRRSPGLDGTDFAGRKGSLPWPLDGVPVSRFGQPRADGRLEWRGLLLRAEPGSPVRAVHRGRVVFADWLRGFGLLTILDHGDGYMTLYGHAEALAKRPGEMVESGEVIAHAGQSGGIRTSGLYFEIRRHGNATDPLQWVVERG